MNIHWRTDAEIPILGHLMWRTDSFEKTLMLGKIEGRRRGWQRMRWLDGIPDSMDTSLSQLQELVANREACCAPVPWGHKVSGMTEHLKWTEGSQKHSQLSQILIHHNFHWNLYCVWSDFLWDGEPGLVQGFLWREPSVSYLISISKPFVKCPGIFLISVHRIINFSLHWILFQNAVSYLLLPNLVRLVDLNIIQYIRMILYKR